ncbi:MAG: hypothetical protein LBB89_13265 [Treponema sp.]|jgi:hypothetical protein|nr:hypothetical protein [Treponema sp.]
MIQLYFLSILCNGIAGCLLFFGNDGEIEKTQVSINNPTFHLVLGILSAVTGILKLLSPISYGINAARGVLVFGDLIPAAAGIVAGLVFIFGIYRKEGAQTSGELDRIGTNLLAFRKPLGIGLMATAFVHFIFGEILFL